MVPHSKRRRAEVLLASAGVNAVWGEPPSAEAILARDAQGFLEDSALTEPAAEDEMALARAFLARHSAQDVAVALLRVFRARLPAPEELSPPPPAIIERAAAPARAARVERADAGPASWFRAGVGRKHNADPKWLIPLICKMGGIRKAQIGAIRVFDRETKFEILGVAAEGFLARAMSSGSELVVSASSAPGPGPATELGPRPAKLKPARAPQARGKEQVRRKKNKEKKGMGF